LDGLNVKKNDVVLLPALVNMDPKEGENLVEMEKMEEIMKKSKLKDLLLEKEGSVEVPMSITKKRKKMREEKERKWYELPLADVDEKTRQELEIFKLKQYMDPKTFVKRSSRELPKYFELGTLQLGKTDYYSEKQHEGKTRGGDVVDTLIKNQEFRKYAKRKFREIQEKKIRKKMEEK